MNIGIVGSRTFTNYNTLKKSMDEIVKNKEDVTIVSGGAKGADTLGAAYSVEVLHKEPVVHNPDYKRWGRYNAPKVRNTKIVEDSDLIVAYWDGSSGGTKDTINKAYEFNKDILDLNYHYLNLQNCKTDKEKYLYLTTKQVKNYILWLDNDDTFLTFNNDNDNDEYITFDNYLGNKEGIPILLDLLGINWSYV